MSGDPRKGRVIRTVDVTTLPDTAKNGELWSECGTRIDNRNQAIAHAAQCCSVGMIEEG
jgi:hypothetical protein